MTPLPNPRPEPTTSFLDLVDTEKVSALMIGDEWVPVVWVDVEGEVLTAETTTGELLIGRVDAVTWARVKP